MNKLQLVKHIALKHGPEVYKALKRSFVDTSKLHHPGVINLLANDVCNSKCTMCNIWQQKLDFEITPEQLEATLKDPLFKNVERVGVTGGEPTMREDLPQLYAAACKALPRLKGMSIITNAIKEKDVISRIEAVAEILKSYNKSFNIMVSLDGVGAVHDEHRGRPGNFESAMKVIDHFRHNTGIPVNIGCTITKGNVWHMDEMLDFLQEEKLYGRFRVGEFIQRLYNEELVDEIRNFSRDEVYHLLCFYERLIREFEPNPKYIRTYRSVQNVLMGRPRSIGCPYQGEGVVLDSKGEILYCAPKSEILGSTLKRSAEEIYFENVNEMSRIKKEHCSECIHDYHAPPTAAELKDVYKPTFWRMITGIHSQRYSLPFIKASASSKTPGYNILIAGWYGTETVGDKAILAGIVQHYQKIHGEDLNVKIASIYPYVTERTLQELGLQGEVIPVYDRAFIDQASISDELIMGGGPLMDMESMSIPMMVVRLARKFNKKSTIFGCGLGPLTQQKYIRTAQYIVQHADEVKLRDQKSVELARKWTGRSDIEHSGDPASDYMLKLKSEIGTKEKKPILACFLREWPQEYFQGDAREFEQLKDTFEKNLADHIKNICKEFHLTPAFYSMHTFTVGGDDRAFYRRFLKKYFPDHAYQFNSFPSSVESIATAMTESSINLCMRYHSVLFAHELDTQYIAVDYTGGGKIKGFLTDVGKMSSYVSVNALASDKKFELAEFLN